MTYSKQLDSAFKRPFEPVKKPSDAAINVIKQSKDISEELKFALIGFSNSDQFSSFFPKHRTTCAQMIDKLMLCTIEELEDIACFGRDHINPNLFYFALSIVIRNRPDLKEYLPPSVAECFPDRFLSAEVFQDAREQLNVVPAGSRSAITVNNVEISSDKDVEQRLNYFRLDLGVNSVYFNWNTFHPFEAIDKKIVDLDRRGELWCYFHQQILARYNAERLCNGLLSVDWIDNLNASLGGGFFPKLCTQYSSHSWPPRFENSHIQNLNRPYEDLVITKTQLTQFIERICNAISCGEVVAEDGKKISLKNEKGIDVLGNILQSSILSSNRKLYGDICNMGHAFLAYCHDPAGNYRQSYSVMGEPATCMRDMLFYRWHRFLLHIIEQQKAQLPYYTEKELAFENIKISSLEVEYSNPKDGTDKNCFTTYWKESDFNIENGMNFEPEGSVYARIKHLNHCPFRYVFKIQNDCGSEKTGTIRVFLCPRYNERKEKLTFAELRTQMIELDRFQQKLTVGLNTITRESTKSTVTVQTENIFQPEVVRKQCESKKQDPSTYITCGWPEYLLIPKGTSEGSEYILFAMVSNGADDCGENENLNAIFDKTTVFCSLRGSKYPDKRCMGYPFDRPAPREIEFIENFISCHSNMKTQCVKIRCKDEK